MPAPRDISRRELIVAGEIIAILNELATFSAPEIRRIRQEVTPKRWRSLYLLLAAALL